MPSKIHLKVIAGHTDGEREFIVNSPQCIGRDGTVCAIYLPLPFISRKHAMFTQRGEVWQIQDMGSSGGTAVDGNQIGSSPVPLTRHGTICLAGYEGITFEYRVVVAKAAPRPHTDNTRRKNGGNSPQTRRQAPRQSHQNQPSSRAHSAPSNRSQSHRPPGKTSLSHQREIKRSAQTSSPSHATGEQQGFQETWNISSQNPPSAQSHKLAPQPKQNATPSSHAQPPSRPIPSQKTPPSHPGGRTIPPTSNQELRHLEQALAAAEKQNAMLVQKMERRRQDYENKLRHEAHETQRLKAEMGHLKGEWDALKSEHQHAKLQLKEAMAEQGHGTSTGVSKSQLAKRRALLDSGESYFNQFGSALLSLQSQLEYVEVESNIQGTLSKLTLHLADLRHILNELRHE